MTPIQMAAAARVLIILALIAFTGWMVALDEHAWAIVSFLWANLASVAPVKPWVDPPPKEDDEKTA